MHNPPKMIAEVCIDEQNRNQPEMVQGLRHLRGILPKKVLGLDEEAEKATVVNPEACIACMMCELRCPDLAIRVIKEEEK